MFTEPLLHEASFITTLTNIATLVMQDQEGEMYTKKVQGSTSIIKPCLNSCGADTCTCMLFGLYGAAIDNFGETV